MVRWGDSVSHLYPGDRPTYIEELDSHGAVRRFYPARSAEEREMLRVLTEDSGQMPAEYDAFEKDIATLEIYFGSKTTVG